MSRSRLRGLGLMTATVLAASLTLSSPASAEGTTGSIAGTITDGGVPVANASIQVRTPDYSFWAYAYTDDSGHYSVADVPEGASAYLVAVTASAHPTQYAYGHANEADADLISVIGGQTTTVDDALLPTGTITGHFVDQAGNGVSASVTASSDNSPAVFGWTDPATGAYTLHVLAGTYRVNFSTTTNQYAYGTRNYFDAATFTVAVGQTVTVDDTLLATGRVSGHVTAADGSPAADVSVQLETDNGSGPSAMTDANGDYTITDVLPGVYTVQFRLPSGATEYAHHKFGRANADTFTVVADQTTTVDEQLPATGAIAGRFTGQDGAGLAGVQVYVTSTGPSGDSLFTTTDGDGRYRVDGFPGSYVVYFEQYETYLSQYAVGHISFRDADTFPITGGQITMVDDQRLPVGSVRFTARDSLTGAPVDDFFVNLDTRGGSSENGALVLDQLAIGQYTAAAGATGYAYDQTAATFTVTAGQQTQVELSLVPVGRITTKVIDRKTGLGVADVCVLVATQTRFSFPDGCNGRSDQNGDVTLDIDKPGTYNLFVLPDRGSVYGAQWVGAKGGTGTQTAAADIAVTSGHTTTGPQIKLDRSGTITGKVTGAGGPLVSGYVGIVGPDLGAGTDVRYSPIAADGTYKVDFLGPYKWPLLFGARNHAYQWSGGTGNRLTAALVPVKSEKTTEFDYTMKVGTDVTITYGYPGLTSGRFVVRNAVTGDPMAVGDLETLPGSLHVLVIGPQTVKVECFCAGDQWHGGTDFASATSVSIPDADTAQIVFTLP